MPWIKPNISLELASGLDAFEYSNSLWQHVAQSRALRDRKRTPFNKDTIALGIPCSEFFSVQLPLRSVVCHYLHSSASLGCQAAERFPCRFEARSQLVCNWAVRQARKKSCRQLIKYLRPAWTLPTATTSDTVIATLCATKATPR